MWESILTTRELAPDLGPGPTDGSTDSRRHTECTNCRSHGVTGTTATTEGLCGHCSRFQSDNKCLPDQRIVRAWDRGSKSIPNGWVMECKAAAKVKPGRSRAS